MAIQFARARYISRSSGGSAVRSAAYNARDAIMAERTGEVFFFRHRDAPTHHEVLLPDGAAESFRESGVLWNAAEAAERRKDAQVAREIVLALPADQAISTEDRIDLARSFADQHFVAKGLAVQLDVHAPHEGESESERANWHAHLLITTRRIEGEKLSAKKARDLDPEVRRAGGRAVVGDAEAWGVLWRDHQNRYFREHGLDLQVDPTATHAAEHIGPVRMRRAGSEILQRAEAVRQANEAAARDPNQVLATLTRNNATFTERDLDRHLAKHITEDSARAATRAAVLGHAETLPLFDRTSGAAAERYTTKTVRAQERAALTDAKAVAQTRHHRALPIAVVEIAASSRQLRPDQRQAFKHAVAAGGLKIIEGRAGTGKSYAVQAVRDAHEQAGRRVVGLAPTNAVAQDLKADGFTEAGTVHAALFALKNGRTSWDRRTVVVVDEAAMLDSKITGELFAATKRAGAKVILAGDDRQLASIERGGLFTELRQRHGAAEISEVTRQRSDWQRQAARDLADGHFAAAVGAFDQAGAITWTQNQAEARTALVEAWKRDTAADPQATRFVFAYTNRDVDALNAELRQVRRDRGDLAGLDVRFETKHGPANFAPGDRVQFTDTDKRLRIYNGNVGTITAIDAATGTIRARLDAAAAQQGREVVWSAEDFDGFRHGYAGTIYKGQGKTLDHTYLYHTHHWRAAASYVALTRQRESAQVFVARETTRDAAQLARQMAREEIKAASVAWATRGELQQIQKAGERQVERAAAQQPTPTPAQDRAAAFWRDLAGAPSARDSADAPKTTARADPVMERGATPEPQPAAHGWLVPPVISRDGRDSRGRSLDPADITAAVAADARVQKARSGVWQSLERAYRDPLAAHDTLEALIKAEGWRGAAQRIEATPNQLGRLRGRDGIFAGHLTRLERAGAISAAGSVAHTLVGIADAEQRAERDYRAEVAAQIARDRVGVPKLSAEAAAVLEAVHAAASREQSGEHGLHAESRNRPAVAQAWEEGRRNPAIAAEIDRFEAAARQRLGEAGVTAAFQAVWRGERVSVAGVGHEHRQALHEVARGLVAAHRGRVDHDEQRNMETFRQREQQQERLRHRQGRSLGLGR